MRNRNGQIVLLLVFILVILTSLVLLNVDIFTSVRKKTHIQHGGDAAAIAAAHKQGEILNEIGKKNIEHLVAAIRDETNLCRSIVMEQRHMALLDPVDALKAADEAARANGMATRSEFSKILQRHVDDIRTVYSEGASGEGAPYPEPFPGAWVQYASKISNVILGGLAAGPDNLEFYDSLSGHLLLNRQFYNAIAAKDWCWFHFNNKNILDDYGSYTDWAPLPAERENPLDNSEVFSLHIYSRKISFKSVFTNEEILEILRRYSDEKFNEDDLNKSKLLADPEEVWFFFEPGRWSQWFIDLALASDGGMSDFPIVGGIKDEYNVRGCAAVLRCIDENTTVAVNSTATFNWSAAAKPFGAVEDFEGTLSPVTALNYLVVPAFTDVRLVPLDAVGGSNLATADYGWVTHIQDHLPIYMENGPSAISGSCYYCDQLKAWERESFRRSGSNWLKFNSHTCQRPMPGGTINGGGTSHGH